MNKRDKDRLVVVAARVADLRAQLAEAEGEFNQILESAGIGGSNGSPTPPSAVPEGEARQRSDRGALVRSLLGIFEARPATVLSITEVVELLGGPASVNVQSVRSTLARLASEDRLVNTEHGSYKLPMNGGGS